MNKPEFDFNDFLQITCLTIALVLGFLPNLINFKDENRINKRGIFLTFTFGIMVLLTIYSTLSKSWSDKEAYINLSDSTNTTLVKVNETIDRTGKIIALGNESVSTLKNIQENELEIQNKSILNTEALVAENKRLSTRNIKLTEELEPLIIKAEKLTKQVNSLLVKVHSEQTGGDAIPFVTPVLTGYGDTYLDGYGYFNDYSYMWTLDFFVKNIGDYTLNNVSISIHTVAGRNESGTSVNSLPSLNMFISGEQRQLGSTIVLDSVGKVFEYDSNSYLPSNIYFQIIVTWKVNYTLNVFIDKSREKWLIRKDYTYNDKQYDSLGIVNKIRLDLGK